jgi:hypothetical protein
MRIAAIVFFILVGLAAQAADIDVTGSWSGKTKTSVNGKVEEDTIYLSLKQTANLVTGTAGPSFEQQAPIANGKIEGNHITFELPVPGGAFKFDLNIEGDRLQGDVVATAQGQTIKADMEATRIK